MMVLCHYSQTASHDFNHVTIGNRLSERPLMPNLESSGRSFPARPVAVHPTLTDGLVFPEDKTCLLNSVPNTVAATNAAMFAGKPRAITVWWVPRRRRASAQRRWQSSTAWGSHVHVPSEQPCHSRPPAPSAGRQRGHSTWSLAPKIPGRW